MKYRSGSNGEQLSILGFGCMRFPKKGSAIDFEETEKEILTAINRGVNYFDTAYIYPGSEETLGRILAKNSCRDKVMLATKLPHYLLKKETDLERYFQEQLKRLQTDHIDYYLMHMLPDVKVFRRLETLGLREWLAEKKQEGSIRHVGFSYHGNTAEFLELLEVYDWEFCQIQYNYMDEFSQAGKKGLQTAAEKHIPVIIMEPLRGGRLVSLLPKAAIDAFEKAVPGRKPADWAFRWLWNQPEVTVVLSGMNSMDMLQENIAAASEMEPHSMTERELAVYEDVKKEIQGAVRVPCTGCAYCMPCPAGVDIPGSFRCYNASYTDSYSNGFREYFMCTTMRAKEKRSNVSRCIGCGACEVHCPQGISIRQDLKRVKRRFENPAFHFAAAIVGTRYGK